MNDINFDNNSKPPSKGNHGILLIVLFGIFIFACLIAPHHIWIFLCAFMIAIGSLFYFNSGESNSRAKFSDTKGLKVKKREGQLSQQRLAETLQFPAYILDAEGRVIYANKTSVVAFGRFVSGDKIFIRFRQPELRHLIEKALHSKKALIGEYNEPRPKDRWFAFEISPIPNVEGDKSLPLFLLGFHDLTEAKRTDQMRSDFIANASHELRTPLASFQGYLETIKGPARKDEKAIDKFTDVMLDQARRMTRLVNDLLSLSRIEMQSHRRPSEVVDLYEVITSVIDSLESVASQMGVVIEFKNTKPIHIIGDRDELLQVFENLIENACKYGEEGKRVLVSLDADDAGKNVTASIQDFGAGIALEHQNRITERFYRVDVENSKAKQGTGLGLAIVKHILNRHETKLGLQSKFEKGARFFIKFPIAKE